MTVEITEASHALGAVVHGVDASGTIAARDWDRSERAFRRHYLLVFRCPELDEEAHLEVMRRFGPLALEGRDGALRPVGFVSNHRPDGSLGSNAASFHIDYGFFPKPYEVISLYGLEIPPSGTETRRRPDCRLSFGDGSKA
jgi:taurine dioxygenase